MTALPLFCIGKLCWILVAPVSPRKYTLLIQFRSSNSKVITDTLLPILGCDQILRGEYLKEKPIRCTEDFFFCGIATYGEWELYPTGKSIPVDTSFIEEINLSAIEPYILLVLTLRNAMYNLLLTKYI